MDIHALAERQLADYDRHRPGTFFADPSASLTIDDAYRLQMEVVRLREERGEAVAGYKVGCVTPMMQANLGIDRPVFGHVFEGEIHRSGVLLDWNRYDGLAVEGEIAVRLAEDTRGIAAAFVVIELHNYVFRNAPPTAQELIGNNAIHAGAVLPAAVLSGHEPRLEDPGQVLDEPLSVRKNGELLGTATARMLPDGPAGSVARLAEHLARFGRRLRGGQIVLTGTPLPLYRVAEGDCIEVECERLGGTVKATIDK